MSSRSFPTAAALIVFASILIAAAASQRAFAADAQQAKQTQANVMTELAFTAGKDYADPFNDVTTTFLRTAADRER